MTNPDRVILFKKALDAFVEVEQSKPDYPPYVSIHNQLLYLIAIAEGTRKDKEKLEKINLGVLTMREVETGHEKVADLLYEAAGQADVMTTEALIE